MRAIAVSLTALLLVACGGSPPPRPVATGTAPPAGIARYLAGGDSRNDASNVIPWAFAEAKARGASAFFFLGDMDFSPEFDHHFSHELSELVPIPFYPALGNHEIKQFGALSIGQAAAEKAFRHRFLDAPHTPVHSALPDKVVYSVDLPGGVHFVALDNVSQDGFGADQLAWLTTDLDQAHMASTTKHIIVGMHKPLAHNGVSTHGMDRDGPQALADSDAALALFSKDGVSLILASHVHRFAQYTQQGIPTFITGGLGAPLDAGDATSAFHHFLQLDVSDAGIQVTVVKFEGRSSVATVAEPEED